MGSATLRSFLTIIMKRAFSGLCKFYEEEEEEEEDGEIVN